jgi:uncharacterized protein YjbI with pentapeptide repeats
VPATERVLHADCSRCFALCCVAPAFARSADFAIDKPAGHPCPHLQVDSRCGIHPRLRDEGFAGCAVYDCFGAGQHVSQVTFAGRDWRSDPDVAAAMFAALPVVRALHELLWCLAEAAALETSRPLRPAIDAAVSTVEALADSVPDGLTHLDVGEYRAAVGALLQQASELARADLPDALDRRGADLAGARLAGTDLRGASLRGAWLLGADLHEADLRRADLLGADLRGADLRGADLGGALFVTQAQLEAARGDRSTALPDRRRRPAHWTG